MDSARVYSLILFLTLAWLMLKGCNLAGYFTKSTFSVNWTVVNWMSKNEKLMHNTTTIIESNTGPIKILLVTGHRTGGTFIGELFNKNPNAFYLFEPLGAVQEKQSTLGCHMNTYNKICLLNRQYNCDIPEYTLNTKGNNQNACTGKLTVPLHHPGRCDRCNLCFRRKQNWSCNTKFCKIPHQKQNKDFLDDSSDDHFSIVKDCESCTRLNTTFVNHVCQKKEIIAIKVIRICEIDQLMLLWNQVPDLHIIITFRDPRGIYNSRKKVPNVKSTTINIQKTCNTYYNLLKLRNGFDSKRTLFVRYEDFAMNQMKLAERIYSFIGIKMHQSVQAWIRSRSSDYNDHNPYSTHRNSTITATRWRNELNISEVRTIQDMCEYAMREASYKFVSNKSELSDPLFQLFSPWI